MTSMTLFKAHHDQNIAHLYEHLWVAHLSSFFRDNLLYAYIDYTIDATTSQDGVVQVEIYLYTEDAQQLEDMVTDVKISVKDNRVEAGLLQIMAENEEVLGSSMEDLIATLSELDTAPWANHKPNVPQGKSTASVLWPIQSVETQDIVLAIENSELQESFDVAVFYVLCMILVSNLQEDLSDGYGLFTESDNLEKEGAMGRFTNTFKTVLSRYEFSDENEIINDLLTHLLTAKILGRFLENVSRSTDEEILPFKTLSELSDMDVNLEIWKKSITLEKMLLAGKNLKLSLRTPHDHLLIR